MQNQPPFSLGSPPVGELSSQSYIGETEGGILTTNSDKKTPPPTPSHRGRGKFLTAFKTALFWGFIALALGLPLIAFQAAQNDAHEIYLKHRWALWAICGAVVFLVVGLWQMGRNLFACHPERSEGSTADRAPLQGNPSALPQNDIPRLLRFTRNDVLKQHFPLALLLFAIAFPLIFSGDRYLLDMGVLILTYIMLGWGLNIVVGLAGLLDLGYVAFYAVGAYSYALLAHNFGLGFWICLPLSGILAAFFGILLGFPVLRLRGDYLAIVTMAFGEIIRIVLINWGALTGGPNGISGVPRPSFFGLPFTNSEDGFDAFFGLEYSSLHRLIFFYYLILALALFTNFVTLRLRRLPLGRAWEALREDETACRALGINVTLTKLSAFAIGAAFGGFAGCFFATRQGFISPESFNFNESAFILAIVVLGGMGSQIGVALAAALMIAALGALRHMDFLKDIFGQEFDPNLYRMLLFGLAMVVMVVWKPRGLVGNRTPTAFLYREKTIDSTHVKEGHG